MSSPLLWILTVALASASAGLMVQHTQLRRSRRALVAERLTRDLSESLEGTHITSGVGASYVTRAVTNRLVAAGIRPASWHAIAASALAGTALSLGGAFAGSVGTILAAAGGIGTFYLWTAWLASRRRTRILEQLPSFLDHLMRAVDSGASLQQGLAIASDECAEPLAGVFDRVNRAVQLGANLEDAVALAESIGIRELGMIALTIRVNQRFGGSVRHLLENVVEAIRLRDQGRRELRALTGETRLSAWVLGTLPIGIALYIASVNPEYLGKMWSDPTGRSLLYVAAGLQVLGSIVLWRMVRSI